MTILDRFRLDGRVAILTGASSGLGVGFAAALAEAGADLALGARRADRLAETCTLVENTGRHAIAVRTNVADPDDCTALVDAAMSTYGRVDILVNNAGVGTAIPALKETPDQFRSVIEINLNGCYWMAQACARVMRPGSSIVNIASVLGLTTTGLPQAAYSSSKAGIIGLTRALAHDLADDGITVNCVVPGLIGTPRPKDKPEPAHHLIHQTITGERGKPEDVAAVVRFLCSPAARYITGQAIHANGGAWFGG